MFNSVNVINNFDFAKTGNEFGAFATNLFTVAINMIEQVDQNKSGLLLKNILQDTQIYHLFTKIIKTESIYRSYENAMLEGFDVRTQWSN
jgi:hypothetical protein